MEQKKSEMRVMFAQLGVQTLLLLRRGSSGEGLQFAPSNVQVERTFRQYGLISIINDPFCERRNMGTTWSQL